MPAKMLCCFCATILLLLAGGCSGEHRLSIPEAASIELNSSGEAASLTGPEEIQALSEAAAALRLEKISYPGGETDLLLYEISWCDQEQEQLLQVLLLDDHRLSCEGVLYRIIEGEPALLSLLEQHLGGAEAQTGQTGKM